MVSAVLWSTMTERFPAIDAILEDAAPMTAALTRRVAALPPLARLPKLQVSVLPEMEQPVTAGLIIPR